MFMFDHELKQRATNNGHCEYRYAVHRTSRVKTSTQLTAYNKRHVTSRINKRKKAGRDHINAIFDLNQAL